MRSLRHIVLKSFFAVGLLVQLAACDTTTGLDLGTEAPVSMKEMSYKAADSLVAQTQKTLPAGTPILIGTLSDVNQMETSTPLGRMIAEQVGTRLVQRGFIVSDVRFRNAINVKETASNKGQAGEYFLSRDTSVLKGEQDVGAVVTGTYVKAKREVLVNLRMIDARSSRVLAATDYRVPVNSDVRALTNNDSAVDANGNPDPYAYDWGW